MSKFIVFMKRYRFFFALFVLNIVLLFVLPDIGYSAFAITLDNLFEMLYVMPPIFLLLGLLDVWVERETMIKYMGEGSGLRGALIAFLMGSAAAGPLYAAFPIAGVLLKKGVKLFNVFLFIGAWATTKIPMLLFETTSMGSTFMLLRLACNIVGITLIAVILERTTSEEEKKKIYETARSM